MSRWRSERRPDQPAAGGASEQALIVRDVCKDYESPAGPLRVLRGVSLELDAGQTLAVLGASGCGKSTLLNIVGSLDRPTSGEVRLAGRSLAELRGEALAAFRSRQVGFVFQDHHLLPQCTAVENVLLPTLAVGASGTDADRAAELLERVGLAGRRDHLPGRLSGGERQRVAIARAMMNGPRLLLCDEPTGNLDRATGDAVAELFLELARERGMMVLMVTHDLELASRSERRMELREGALHGVD
ncbi:MAG: ABC transporter ATP-binding protein [Candidatus Brocadiaceae bacterium]|nr:ABC transporter ATP-binding protein [Candidatus Brocadiaceae bacterium]